MMTIILPSVSETSVSSGDATLGDISGNSGFGFGKLGAKGLVSIGSGWRDSSSNGLDASGSGSLTMVCAAVRSNLISPFLNQSYDSFISLLAEQT